MTFDELLTLVSSNNAPALCTNSHLAEAGGIFVALEGAVCDGNDFIDEALGRGAKYIVSQKPCRCPRACLRQADAGAAKYNSLTSSPSFCSIIVSRLS